MNKINKIIVTLIILSLLIIPFSLSNYFITVLTIFFIMALCCQAWNIIGGYAGQLALGHIAFFGIGSYSTVFLLSKYQITPFIGIIVGLILSIFLAWILGSIVFKFKLTGAYFAIATLLFAEILHIFALKSSLFGRAMGIQLFPEYNPLNLQFGGNPIPFYYISFVCLILVTLFVWKLSQSKFGYQLVAVREGERTAFASGIDANKVKLKAFILSAMITSFGGALHGLFLGFVVPEHDLNVILGFQFIFATMVGGRGTVWGPILGMAILTVVQEGLTELGQLIGDVRFFSLNQVIYGFILVLVVIYMPNGLIDLVKKIIRNWNNSLKKRSDMKGEIKNASIRNY